MKTFLRIFLYLALIVWLGGETFFPVVAAITFNTLVPDTHSAGLIVGGLLRILHGIGLISGVVAMVILALAPTFNVYKQRRVMAPLVLLLVMIAGTAYSQYGIIPAMERDRIAAGGAIDGSDPTNPNTADFNRLHVRSTWVEETVLLLGLVTVGLVAWAESSKFEQLNSAS